MTKKEKRPIRREWPAWATSARPGAHSTIAERLRWLVGSQSVASFAREAGIPESTMRLYLAGASPNTEPLKKIAAYRNVSMDWLAKGIEPRTTELREEGADRLLAAYQFEAVLTTVLEAAQGVVKTSPAQRRLVTRAVGIYVNLPAAEREAGGSALVRQIIDRLLEGEKP